jgi:hypothetical protein
VFGILKSCASGFQGHRRPSCKGNLMIEKADFREVVSRRKVGQPLLACDREWRNLRATAIDTGRCIAGCFDCKVSR